MSRHRARTLEGTLEMRRGGFGFVQPEKARDGADVFVPPESLRNAIHGDRVLVAIDDGPQPSRGPRGTVVRVLQRPDTRVVGQVFRVRRSCLVRPIDGRFLFDVHLADSDQCPTGKIVVVALVGDPGRLDPPFGRLLEVLGDQDDPDIQYKIVCAGLAIPMHFSQQVLSSAETISGPEARLDPDRTDWRHCVVVTIDGEDARDFDDAVSLETKGDRFVLRVHIADVSHYVEEGGLIDEEARRRGTSVYFPDRAIPMLPERLSNDICSLRPDQDRLTVTVNLTFDPDGERRDIHVERSIIRSARRLTYREVQSLLEQERPRDARVNDPLDEMLRSMQRLSRLLRRRRLRRGAIDLDLPEPRVVFDSDGGVTDIVESERLESHRIIEEFMLAANEAVAEFLVEKGVPLIFRIHEPPDTSKVERFQEVAGQFGYGMAPSRGGRFSPKEFQRILEKLRGRNEHRFLSYLMLRSFKQARYSEKMTGHFGLASKLYTHFTSPIRRYPDLVVHRILKIVLDGRHKTAPARHFYGRLGAWSEHCSQQERRATEAERAVLQWMTGEFMRSRLGDEFRARVTAVSPNGFRIQLEDHFVSGFVHVETLRDDYYAFKSSTHTLVGERTRRRFHLGGGVLVRVDRADPLQGTVDFSVVG